MHHPRGPGRVPRALLAAIIVALLGLAALWRFGPLAQLLTLEHLLNVGTAIKSTPAGPFWLAALFALVSLAGIPVVLLIVCAEVLLGPVLGSLCALTGSALSAALGFGIGRAFGPEAVRRLAGRAVDAVSRRLARRGLLTVVVVRLLPVAPFTVINVIAGASHIRLRHFLLGTVIGMAPGTAGLALVSQHALDALAAPTAATLVRLAAAILFLAAAACACHRWLRASTLDKPVRSRTRPARERGFDATK